VERVPCISLLGENIVRDYTIKKRREFQFVTDQLISKSTLKAYIKLILRLNCLIHALIALGPKKSCTISKRVSVYFREIATPTLRPPAAYVMDPFLVNPKLSILYLKWYKDRVELYL